MPYSIAVQLKQIGINPKIRNSSGHAIVLPVNGSMEVKL